MRLVTIHVPGGSDRAFAISGERSQRAAAVADALIVHRSELSARTRRARNRQTDSNDLHDPREKQAGRGGRGCRFRVFAFAVSWHVFLRHSRNSLHGRCRCCSVLRLSPPPAHSMRPHHRQQHDRPVNRGQRSLVELDGGVGERRREDQKGHIRGNERRQRVRQVAPRTVFLFFRCFHATCLPARRPQIRRARERQASPNPRSRRAGAIAARESTPGGSGASRPIAPQAADESRHAGRSRYRRQQDGYATPTRPGPPNTGKQTQPRTQRVAASRPHPMP